MATIVHIPRSTLGMRLTDTFYPEALEYLGASSMSDNTFAEMVDLSPSNIRESVGTQSVFKALKLKSKICDRWLTH